MYLKDLRAVINECTPAELKQIIVELYKTMPKEIKEERDIDAFIHASNKSTEAKITQQRRKQFAALMNTALVKEKPKFITVNNQVVKFINNVRSQVYFKANNKISEDTRLNWHVTLKESIQQLQAYPPESVHGGAATELLGEIFILLNESYYFNILIVEDAYHSLGLDTLEFYEMIVKRAFHKGATAEAIRYSLNLVIEKHTHPSYTMNPYLAIILEELSGIASRKLALETAESMIPRFLTMRAEKNHINSFLAAPEAIFFAYNTLIQFITEVQFKSGTYEKGVRNFINRSQKIEPSALYSYMLEKLAMHDNSHLFKEIYREAHDKQLELSQLAEEIYHRYLN